MVGSLPFNQQLSLILFTDTLSMDELKRASKWFITEKNTSRQVYLALRDRAMLLLSCATAFRGDSVRPVLLSDLFTKQVAFPALGPSASILVSLHHAIETPDIY
jgi:hypothetical protein